MRGFLGADADSPADALRLSFLRMVSGGPALRSTFWINPLAVSVLGLSSGHTMAEASVVTVVVWVTD